MTDADAQKIIDAVRDFSNGTNTTEAAVVELAKRCKKFPFKILGPDARVVGPQNPRNDYYVGKIRFDGSPPKLQFSCNRDALVNPKVFIPSVYSVRMIPATELLINSRPSRNPLSKTPTLETFKFKNGQYAALNLATAPANSVVLTSELSGCTFAIGCAGSTLYLGHAQPIPNTPFAATGQQIGDSIKKTGTAIFEGVAEGALQSLFLIKNGNEFKVKDSSITYVNHANVLGLIRDRKIYFIVTITTGASWVDVEKVFLISQETSQKWRCVPM